MLLICSLRLLRQILHAESRSRQNNASQREEKPKLDGLFRSDRIPKNLPVHFRRDIQPSFRHSIRTKQFDCVEFDTEHPDSGSIVQNQRTESSRLRIVQLREKTTFRTIRQTEIERQRFRRTLQTFG